MNEEATEVTLLVVEALDRLGVSYAIVGSLASSLYGLARSTLDTDLIADIRPEHVSKLINEIGDVFYVSEEEVTQAIHRRSSFNIIHYSSVFKVDIFIPKDRPFDKRQLCNRQLIVVTSNPSKRAYVASAEDTILAKLDWYKLGQGISERQWLDILGIIRMQSPQLDRDYLRKGATELHVENLLEEALENYSGS